MLRKLFDKYRLKVEVETFSIKGKKEEYLRLVQPDVVVILAVDNGRILLERQYRRAIKKYIYELPAGFIDERETASNAVKRELIEETGCEPLKVKLLFKAYEAPARIKGMFYFYLVEGTKRKKKHLDPGEIIEAQWVDVKKFDLMIRNNQIIDLKTIALYNYYKAYEVNERK